MPPLPEEDREPVKGIKPLADVLKGFSEARRDVLRTRGLVPYEQVVRNQQTMKRPEGIPAANRESRLPPPNSGALRNGEIRRLRSTMVDAGLMLNPEAVHTLFQKYPMRGGMEHRVAYLPKAGRVVKDADLHALGTETVHDYMTDFQLANYYFDDDLGIFGAYEVDGRFHLLTTQPYIDGTHPDWEELKSGLVAQGLHDPSPQARSGSFVLEDEDWGGIDIFDVHCDNVIRDHTGWLHPIDVHFYFHDQDARQAVLHRTGLDRIEGESPLAMSGALPVPDWMSHFE